MGRIILILGFLSMSWLMACEVGVGSDDDDDDNGSPQYLTQNLQGNIEGVDWALAGGSATFEDGEFEIELYDTQSSFDSSNPCQDPENSGSAIIFLDAPENTLDVNGGAIEGQLNYNTFSLFDGSLQVIGVTFLDNTAGAAAQITDIQRDDVTNYYSQISGQIDYASSFDEEFLNGQFTVKVCIPPVTVKFSQESAEVSESGGELTISLDFENIAPEDGVIPIGIERSSFSDELSLADIITLSPSTTTTTLSYFGDDDDDGYLEIPVTKGDDSAIFTITPVDNSTDNANQVIFFRLLDSFDFEPTRNLGGVEMSFTEGFLSLTVTDDDE